METEKIMKALSDKIPNDKIMAVLILLPMIDTKAWKFPEKFKTNEYAEICDIIENCVELKETVGA